MDTALQENLDQRTQQSLYRSRVCIDSGCGAQLTVQGKSVHNFCSNDYLGLAGHADIAKAFKQGVDQYGTWWCIPSN